MRSFLYLLFLLFIFTSCDDGDIVVTTFEFEDEEFNMCSNERTKLLYHINNNQVFETLSIQISGTQFSNQDRVLITREQPVSVTLSGENVIIYRTYDGAIPNNYFCQSVPPATPRVLQEYRSVGGSLVITTNIIYNSRNGVADHDGDGIPSLEEGMADQRDTDGDGIPDYLDIDDDGDNVRTSVEIANVGDSPVANGYKDTDGDGIPNYLDPDDDGDDVPTRLEVTAEEMDPTRVFNESNTPRYLDRFTSNRFTGEMDFSVSNRIDVRYESVITAQNLKLRKQGDNGEEISFITKDLGIFVSTAVPIIIEPAN